MIVTKWHGMELLRILLVLNITLFFVVVTIDVNNEMTYECGHSYFIDGNLVGDGICDCYDCVDEYDEEFVKSYDMWTQGPYWILTCVFLGSLGSLFIRGPERKNHCRSCDSVVTKSQIKNSLERKISALTDSTQAVTSLNPALGFGASGKGHVMGIGATTSTSHIPIKLAKYQCSVKCPECQHTYYWSQNIKVRIWTSPEGVESIEDLEPISYPFKMV